VLSVGQVVKFPQLESWENFLELFLFEKKAEGKLLALSTIIRLTLPASLSVFLELYVRRKSFCLKD